MALSFLFRSRRAALAAVLVLPSLLAIILLWLPFGFGMVGHIEEWGLLGMFETYGPMPVVWRDGPLALHAVRPLMPSTFYLGYLLSPDSFVSWHLLLMAALLVKGAAAAYLAYKASASARVAAWFGPLVVLYPADTMQLSFRSQHINWAMALVLLAGALLLYALSRERRALRYGLSALGALLIALAAGMYEAALTLAPLPFLIVAASGMRAVVDCVRRHWAALLLWSSGALVYVAYAAWISTKIASYQSSIAGGGRGTLAVLRESWPKLFSIGYLRALVGAWTDAAAIIVAEFASFGYLIGASVALAATLWLLWRRCATPDGAERGAVALRLIPLGLLSCAMGYAPFLLLPTHQVISQRTFLWASPGAALVLLALLMLVAKLSRPLAGAGGVVLLTLALGAQLFQFHHYDNISEVQKQLLRAIVTQVDPDFKGKTLVIRDQTNLLGHTWTFPGNLPDALAYVYGRKVGAIQICHEPAHEWVSSDSLGRRGQCRQDDAGWEFSPPGPASGPGFTYADTLKPQRLAAENAIVLTIRPDFSSTLEAPAAPVRIGGVLERRLNGALAPTAGGWGMFRDQQAQASYRWSFGDWWSMELPTRGSGWREAEWQAEGLAHRALAWKIAPHATLDFVLTPRAAPYVVEGKFGAFASEAVRDGLKLTLNGNALAVTLAPDGSFTAPLPAAWLRPGINEFGVNAPVDNGYYGLSLQLDWFAVRPQSE